MKELIEQQRFIDETYFPNVREETSLEYWAMAIGGETGELLNAMKKYVRGHRKDGTSQELELKIAEEAADILIYLMILSDVIGFDLEEITKRKQEINILRMQEGIHIEMK